MFALSEQEASGWLSSRMDTAWNAVSDQFAANVVGLLIAFAITIMMAWIASALLARFTDVKVYDIRTAINRHGLFMIGMALATAVSSPLWGWVQDRA